MAEGACLESMYTGNRIGGSNPFLSALNLQREKSSLKMASKIVDLNKRPCLSNVRLWFASMK